jgi:hypothetical protein
MTAKSLIFFLAAIPFASYSQALEVKKENSRIEGQNTAGYQVAMSAAESEVRNSLTKYLKGMGKTRISGDYMTVAEPLIKGKKYPNTLYATTRVTGNTVAAWIGMPSVEGKGGAQDSDLKQLVYDFGVVFHREQIQLKIDESVRALQAVEKQQSRLVNQNKDLNIKIETNKREKIQLEKALAGNKVELETLSKKLQENKKAQDSVAAAGEQIKKVVEMHKARQTQIH